ncbi:OS-9 like protein [Termitomyces sp. J132]|nr:OS-9 like protein [Termitomyces sp. J132]
MRILVFAAALAAPVRAARFLHSLPDDAYAFPKYRVAFLNRLPLPSNTAQRWLADGLRGGELEFLDQPWTDRLDSLDPTPQPSVNYTLEQIRLGSKDSYLCLIPRVDVTVRPASNDDSSDFEFVSSRSWSLLQPLSGTCLYHRQGWWTYSYCHNQEIRQFKEATNSAGGHRLPQEDPDWESFTLGKAPQPGADLTVAEQNAQTNLELAQSTGSRYLVQRWSDGTLCDKTHKPREVEVQFHCSMTMTDTILFVKEAKTCSYVLVVNTPRLCGEPGFKSHRDTSEEHQIRCREIVDPQEPSRATDAFDDVPDLLDYPVKVPRRKPVLPAAPAKETPKVAVDGVEVGDKVSSEVVRKALEALMGSKDGKVALQEIAADQNGVVFEIVEETDMSEEQIMAMEKLEETLRAAGHEIKTIRSVAQKGDKAAEKERGQAPTKKNKKPVKRWPWHEEL